MQACQREATEQTAAVVARCKEYQVKKVRPSGKHSRAQITVLQQVKEEHFKG